MHVLLNFEPSDASLFFFFSFLTQSPRFIFTGLKKSLASVIHQRSLTFDRDFVTIIGCLQAKQRARFRALIHGSKRGPNEKRRRKKTAKKRRWNEQRRKKSCEMNFERSVQKDYGFYLIIATRSS